jgi:hypothetical protein
MKAGAKRIGYREITSTRTAINSVARDGRPACQQIGFCWAGCAIGAKWSTLYTEVPKAEETGHFELRTGAMAIKVTHDADGKARSVIYADADGVLHEHHATAAQLTVEPVPGRTRQQLRAAWPKLHAARDEPHPGRHARPGELPPRHAAVGPDPR